jgi:signal transduction histidine kinase
MRTMRRGLDVLLAVAAAVSVLPNLGGDLRPLPVVVVAVAPLTWRRRWPVPVFGGVLAGSAGLALWAPAAVPGLGLLVALATVAALRARWVALVAGAVLEAGVVVTVARLPGPWAGPFALLTALLVAALGVGLALAAQRTAAASLRQRATALERERDAVAALAAAAERARIARELHDIVAHHLTVMVALSDGAAAVAGGVAGAAGGGAGVAGGGGAGVGGTDAPGAEVMRAVAATGRRALAETRRAVGVSRAPLDPLPGIGDLAGLVAGVEAAGLATTLDLAGEVGALPDGVQLAAYRVVQEALTNTLKHAGPGARAAVRLRATPVEVRIDVTDSGGGTAAAVGGGSGLVGMGERVGAYGGSLRSGPRTGGGWQVAACLPVGP